MQRKRSPPSLCLRAKLSGARDIPRQPNPSSIANLHPKESRSKIENHKPVRKNHKKRNENEQGGRVENKNKQKAL